MDTLILILATFALTSALTKSDGPLGAFHKLRKKSWATMLDCFLCSAVMVGAVFALIPADNVLEWIVFSLAFGGGATFLNNLSELDL